MVETPLQPPPSGHLARRQERVLVVEDETVVRRLAVEALRTHGYHVLEAQHGAEALHLVQGQGQETIDLLLTDVVMPHMSGSDLAQWLRAVYPNIKVVFVSGYIENAQMHQALLYQGTTFLPKPYTPTVLALKVREMLDQRSAECDGGD
jgi:CheY-like chemotaxis protein